MNQFHLSRSYSRVENDRASKIQRKWRMRLAEDRKKVELQMTDDVVRSGVVKDIISGILGNFQTT